MSRKILLTTMLLLFAMILSACGGAVGSNEKNTDGKNEPTSEATTEKGNDSVTTEEKNDGATTEDKSEGTTTGDQSESVTTEDQSESVTEEETCVPPVIVPAMPDASAAVKSYVAGDGMTLLQFENMSETDFIAARDYLVNDGFSEYCADSIGTSLI